MTPPAVQIVSGTRPEVLKLAPVVAALEARGRAVRWIDTGQQGALAAATFDEVGRAPDVRLGVSVRGLAAGTAALLEAVAVALAPGPVLVHGDTSSALAGALAAFYAGQPLGHVEAGLRSGDPAHPFPEEQHRVLIDRMATWWFAPTAAAAATLRAEGCAPDRVHTVGNPVVDALHAARGRPVRLPDALLRPGARPRVLVTCHRRENHGAGMEAVAEAVHRLRDRYEVVVVRHPHPATSPVADAASVAVGPLDHASFLHLLEQARVVLTDSGGVQEECVALGRRALVLRRTTERPEGVALGLLELVGTAPDAVVAAVHRVASSPAPAPPRPLPYGAGDAGVRIAERLALH